MCNRDNKKDFRKHLTLTSLPLLLWWWNNSHDHKNSVGSCATKTEVSRKRVYRILKTARWKFCNRNILRAMNSFVYGFVKGCKEPCLREQNLWTRHSGSMKTDLRSLVEWIVTTVLNRSLYNPHTHENMAMNIQELRYCLEYHPLFSLDSCFLKK